MAAAEIECVCCCEDFDINSFFTTLTHLSPGIVSKEMDSVSHSNQATWFLAVRETLGGTEFKKVFTKLNSEIGKSVETNLRPSKDKLFEWTKAFPISQIRAVILGREPPVCQYKKVENHWTEMLFQSSGYAFQPLDTDNISLNLKTVVKSVIQNFKDNFEDSQVKNRKEHEFHLGQWINEEKVLLLNCYTSIEICQKPKSVKNKRGEFVQKEVTAILTRHSQWWVITEALLKFIFNQRKDVIVIHTLDKKYAKPSLDRLFKHKNNVTRVIPVRHPHPETQKEFRKSGLKDIGQGLQRCNDILVKDLKLDPIQWWHLSLWRGNKTEEESLGNEYDKNGSKISDDFSENRKMTNNFLNSQSYNNCEVPGS